MSSKPIATASPSVWRTALSDDVDGRVTLRGYDLQDLAREVDFASCLFLMMTGELPQPAEARMLNAVLVIGSIHTVAPSGAVTRILTACGVPLQVAMACGAMTFGDTIGGAGEELAHAIEAVGSGDPSDQTVPSADESAANVAAYFGDADRRVPGFGHPLHREGDPRGPFLIGLAHEWGVAGRNCEVVTALGDRLTAERGRPVRVNLDGAMAAVLLDLGVPAAYFRAVAVISRSAGNGAHAVEQATAGESFPLGVTTVDYVGPDRRAVPGV